MTYNYEIGMEKGYKKAIDDMAEVQEYGYKVTFGGNSEEEAIKSAFEAGRAIGVLEGENDQLRHFLDFLYNKEFNN